MRIYIKTGHLFFDDLITRLRKTYRYYNYINIRRFNWCQRRRI